MTWTSLIPEPVGEPTGFATLDRGPLAPRGWDGGLPPSDPSAAGPAQAATSASAAVYSRLPGAERIVREWPADFRRLAALQVHLHAVRRWHCDWAPDEAPARLMPVLIDDRIRWSRTDLAWALRSADGYGLYDGAAFLLPGFIAAALSPAELSGFEPALQAVFAEFINERDTPRPVRRLLGERYGTALWQITGQLPPDLLPRHDPFGEFVRDFLGERLDEPGAAELLRHAASLNKPSPTRAWLRAGSAFPVRWPAPVVLDCFAGYRGYISYACDELLRGLVWILSLDPSDEATTLLGQVATTAGSPNGRKAGRSVAPQTAAATVEVLATRSGPVPAQALSEMSRSVANKTLLGRVRTMLHRLPTPTN
ncbi:hypothetical protein Acy02nite_86710 [Actinoplanes cyaneus]|uniref:Uncharacterized protein n=1 Tax=Actinoplanes cyaneus TaxID=52696 RepID=A0A919M5T0_9ACTN|nr:hypothetical protein [Actinoplanes cyaneus]GID70790.1 hypothetical protein Acy02nite_86710 [Actinoplanes cyaneus]